MAKERVTFISPEKPDILGRSDDLIVMGESAVHREHDKQGGILTAGKERIVSNQGSDFKGAPQDSINFNKQLLEEIKYLKAQIQELKLNNSILQKKLEDVY